MDESIGGDRATGAWRLRGAGPDRHLTLPLLESLPGLVHAFTLRGSDPGAVLLSITGRPLPLLSVRQVHGRVVRRVEEAGTNPPASPPPEGDALVTSRRGAALGVHVADCVPILLCDARGGVVGAAHAGWRGTVAGVLRATITAMEEAGARPRDLYIGLGPAIGPCCFEVGPEVVESFRRADPEAGRSIRDGRRARIDLVDANRRQAIAAGVREDRIAAAGLCTVCRPDLLESYRRSRGSASRMTGLVVRLG